MNRRLIPNNVVCRAIHTLLFRRPRLPQPSDVGAQTRLHGHLHSPGDVGGGQTAKRATRRRPASATRRARLRLCHHSSTNTHKYPHSAFRSSIFCTRKVTKRASYLWSMDGSLLYELYVTSRNYSNHMTVVSVSQQQCSSRRSELASPNNNALQEDHN